MKTAIKRAVRSGLEPMGRFLAGVGIEPDHVTWAGLALSGAAGAAVAFGAFLPAFVLLLLGSVADMVDGAIARGGGAATLFGAFLDSTVDRYAELFFFAGVAVYFHRIEPSTVYLLLAVLGAGGSFLVSYTRARAEGLGVECAVGLMERPERLILLTVGVLFGAIGLKIALWILVPLVFFTAGQRIRHVRGRTRGMS